MVFVTVGSTKNDFRRLFEEVDRLVEQNVLADVVAQVGTTGYRPRHFRYFKYLPHWELAGYVKEAQLVICHAGTGTLDLCLGARVKTIAVPRRRRFGEHPDDHQLELAEYLSAANRILVAYDISALAALVGRSRCWAPSFKPESTKSTVIEYMKVTVEELVQQGSHRARLSLAQGVPERQGGSCRQTPSGGDCRSFWRKGKRHPRAADA